MSLGGPLPGGSAGHNVLGTAEHRLEWPRGVGMSTMRLKAPVIILGNTRSGTTVLQAMLAEHPDLTSWYEPRNMWQFADPGRPHDEFDASDATERVQRYVRARFLARQRAHGDRVVVEKTPVNILRLPYVRKILPEATWLFIVRNPFSFINSVERKWQRTVTPSGARRRLADTPTSQVHHYAAKYARQLVDKHVLRRRYLSTWGPRYREMAHDLETLDQMTVIARQWAVCSQRAEQALVEFPPDRVMRLRYEDFVTDPVNLLDRAAQHCGLAMTEQMADNASRLVDPTRREKWRRLDPDVLTRLLPELEPEMVRHGYEVPPELRQRAQDRRQGISAPPRPLGTRPGLDAT